MSGERKIRSQIESQPTPTEQTSVPTAWEQELAKALEDIRAKLGESKTSKRLPLFTLDAVALLARKFTAALWLIAGLITRGGIGIIGAEPKATKTWLGTEIAIACATGTRVCGEFLAERCRTLYFYAEDMEQQIHSRIRSLLDGAERTLDDGWLFLEPRGAFLDVLKDEDLAWVVASVRAAGGAGLVVLDPLSDIHSNEENTRDGMRPVMRRLRVLSELLDNCTVVVIHHLIKLNKDNAKRRPGQNLRGSGAIHASVDSGLYLGDTGGDERNVFSNTVVSQVKGAQSAGRFKIELTVKDDEQGQAIDARWTFSRDVTKPSTNTSTTDGGTDLRVLAWIRELGTPMTKTELKLHPNKPLGISQRTLVAAIDRLLDQGLLTLHAGRVACS